MKWNKNVNYLERRNNYPGSTIVQPPEYYETHKLPFQAMTDEEAKLKAEENEIKKGIPINIAPFALQTLGINISKPLNAGYTNPFAGGVAPHTGLNPPKLINLDDYDLSSESELYTENDLDSYTEEITDQNLAGTTKGVKSRYDIVRESEENKFIDQQPIVSQISSVEFLNNQKGRAGRKLPSRRPGQIDDELDPEIENAKKSYKKKGRIEIKEEDEYDNI